MFSDGPKENVERKRIKRKLFKFRKWEKNYTATN